MTWRWILIAYLLGGFTHVLSGQTPDGFSEHRLDANPPQKPADQESNTGTIVGQLVDTHSQRIFVGKAAVFLCDAKTGMPIHTETKKPISPSIRDPQIDKMWIATTDEKGSFEFESVPVGKYRLIAQSWSGTEGFLGFDANKKPSAFVILHGIAENVEVKSGERTGAYPRQLGNHVLRITNDPEEPHALLLISLQPTVGDGILGPWGKAFYRNLIGATQMEVPYVTILGLPEHASVHVGLMNYDNNPGIGAASFEPGQREGRLRIIASWSNGHKDPPPRLVELTNHLEKNKIDMASFLPPDQEIEPNKTNNAVVERLVADNNLMVDVEGLGEYRLADVLAAYGYLRMKKYQR